VQKELADGEGARGSLAPRKVLVVSATHRDHRELRKLAPPGIDFLFHDYASTSLEELISGIEGEGACAADPDEEVDRVLAGVDGTRLSAVISTDDYPGSALAAIVAQRLGLPGPDPRVVLIAQHKYLSRAAQAKLVPDAVPPFMLIDAAAGALLPDDMTFPVFVKPVKSFFSVGAEKVGSLPELAALLPRWRTLDQFFLPLERMLERYAGESIGSKRLIAEGVLKGAQVTVEGYAFGGKVSVLGIVDSIMFPGTIAFSRFDYPSHLPEDVQARMAGIAVAVMEGLGFDNGLFNIEMMYDADADRVSIIEINPRMASQFADLYEASCVLRAFEDRRVMRLPDEGEIKCLEALYPEIRVELHATVGRKLSDELQDGHSYRYGIINLGGRDLADVLGKFEAVRQALGIAFGPIDTPPQQTEAEVALAAG
jgi:biotin carboxylase